MSPLLPHEASVDANPLRVVQSVRYRWLALTETWLYNQVRFLPPSIEPHVVAKTAQNRGQFEVPHLHLLEDEGRALRALDGTAEALRLRRYPGYLVRTARRIQADLMHAHFGPWGWSIRGAARRAGTPLVVTFYGYDVNQLPTEVPRFRARYQELFQDAAAVLCEGEHMRSEIIRLGCAPEKAHVQRLGIDLDRIQFRPRSLPSSGRLRVLLASAFREKKGLPIAIEALGRLKNELDLEITLIGDASALAASQDEKGRILRAIDAAGLSERVTHLGFQPHTVMLEQAQSHDLFLAPSRTASDGDTEGGAPVALIEMAASGIPVVSTTHCDIPGVVLDGTSGVLAREGDVDAFEGALRRALEIGPGWEAMTRRGRAHVESSFCARSQGRKLAERYRMISQAA